MESESESLISTLLPSSEASSSSKKKKKPKSNSNNMKEEETQVLIEEEEEDTTIDNNNIDNENENNEEELSSSTLLSSAFPREKSAFEIIAILSTAFSYGCIMTTLFIITLPVECERIQNEHPAKVQKSVALGCFVAIAGITQLVSPIIGRLSDTYKPPHGLGQRLPYLIFGSLVTIFGLVGQAISSYWSIWIRYGFAFFCHMIGLNIIYAIMIALIPDQIPTSQTGVANGTLALLIVLGSLFGFALFHSVLHESVWDMYGLYISVVIVTTILTGSYAHQGDVDIARRRHMNITLNLFDGSNHNNDSTVNGESSNNNNNINGGGVDEEGGGNIDNVEGISRRNPNNNNNNNDTSGTMMTTPLTPRTQCRRRRRRQATQKILYPMVLLKSILYDPIRQMDWKTLLSSYTIDTTKYHDFFIVTISRTFYYMGISVQTFFLYYLHDIIKITNDPEAAVATLAILGNVAGSITCYPVGYLSDQCFSSRRKPFVYFACIMLAISDLSLIYCRSYVDALIVGLCLGASNGIYLTMDTSLAVDTLPSEIELEAQQAQAQQQDVGGNTSDNNNSGHAQLLGIWGVAGFIGSALGPLIGGPMLYIFGQMPSSSSSSNGDNNDDEQGYSLRGYAVVLSLSAFYFFCSAMSLRFIKKPNV